MKGEEEQTKRKEELILTCVLIFLASASLILGIIVLGQIQNAWLQAHYILCAFVYAIIIAALYATAAFFLFIGKKIVAKMLLSVFVLLVFALIVTLILQNTGFFNVFRDAESLQAYLESAGVWMPILYVLLQFLQVVLLPIPSIVSTVAGIALFGPFQTTLYSFIGIMLGSLLAFYIGRKWGKKAVIWMVGEESLSKWQKKLKGKDNVFLSIMFLLPLFPDDVLCFLAGLSSMSFSYFLIIIGVSRILAIASTCYSVNFIPFDTWWGLTIWGIILALIIFSCVFVYKNMDKIQKYLRRFRRKKDKNQK